MNIRGIEVKDIIIPLFYLLNFFISLQFQNKNITLGFSGGSVVKNRPARTGDPWVGKIPCAMEQLSPCTRASEPVLQSPRTATVEPVHPEPVLPSKRSHLKEKPAHCNQESPPLAAPRESPRAEMKGQHSHKYIKSFKKKLPKG